MVCSRQEYTACPTSADFSKELSIAPEKNAKLVPFHARKELLSRGIDLDNLVPLTREDMTARLD